MLKTEQKYNDDSLTNTGNKGSNAKAWFPSDATRATYATQRT